MADPLPVAPDEAVNRARVAAIAQGGMSAAQQVPGIATAPEAMQTAMARSAGMNAPDAFNATQVGTIQHPFDRADSQLAANQGGAAGVLGSINSSTQDYLQKAAGGLDIQKEITRRAVQQLAQQHTYDADKLALDRENIAAQREANRIANDPNSMANRIKKKEEENKWAELNTKPLAKSAAPAQQIQARSGLAPDTQKQIAAQPWFKSQVLRADGEGIVDSTLAVKGDANYFRTAVEDNVATGVKRYNDALAAGKDPAKIIEEDPLALNPANAPGTIALIYETYGPMFPNYQETNFGASQFAQNAFANKFAQASGAAPAVIAAPPAPTTPVPQTPYSAIGAQEPYGAQQTVVPSQQPPPWTSAAMWPRAAAMQAAVSPPAQAAPILSSQAQAHLNEQANIAEAERAGVLTPQTVSMSETDAKKLAKAAAAVKTPRGKSKRK